MNKKNVDLSLLELMNMYSTFSSLENVIGFKTETILKITHAQYEIEKHVNPFTKARSKSIQDKRIVDIPKDYEKDIRYTLITNDGVKMLLKTEDYLKIDKDYESKLDKVIKEISLPSFKHDDFEIEKEVVENDKKVTKNVNVITAGLMKNLFKLLEK